MRGDLEVGKEVLHCLEGLKCMLWSDLWVHWRPFAGVALRGFEPGVYE